MSTDDQLPAESRGTPAAPEPTIEVDAQAHVPPEAAVVALTPADGDGRPTRGLRTWGTRPSPRRRRPASGPTPPPPRLRVAPTVEPTVDLDEGAHVPPEAAVVPEHDAPS